MNIEIIKGVRCYVDKDGVAQINLEDVARGLGFTQTKGNTEYIPLGKGVRPFGQF